MILFIAIYYTLCVRFAPLCQSNKFRFLTHLHTCNAQVNTYDLSFIICRIARVLVTCGQVRRFAVCVRTLCQQEVYSRALIIGIVRVTNGGCTPLTYHILDTLTKRRQFQLTL